MKPNPNIRTVSAAEAGQKLVQYLGRVLGEDAPGSVLMRWIRTGQVRVDGKRAKPFDRVAEGQSVRIPPFAELRPVEERAGAGAPLDLPVLAETPDWLVIAKPAGLPVHPGSGWTDSVQTRLAQAFAGSAFVPTIAHRLDRDTSGVLLAARTHQALTRAHAMLAARETDKRYLCWVLGEWGLSALREPVEMADRLEKAGAPGRERMEAGEEGKEARLVAVPLRIEADRALLEVRLLTGRTHQIRAQLASRGHPIAGDAKYGGGKPPMRLHAWKLTIGEETFACPPPWSGRWDAGPFLP
ncbi:RluA family pseudouridine synthase [Fundidesulfovibrio soli]|uniref:RluA family pseudouridine synthase n=1 Tax=Fundidesulfovibrio soli TaxID=2922716 RepID=UPI001FAEB354|nr:RluA family pseudouridine synthase [Fundidesulfovibrio soli]